MTKKKDSITPKKKKFTIENGSTVENETRAFINAIKSVEIPSPLSMVLYRHYNDEMQKAVSEGRICTPERMAKLYPIFREINIEQEEIQAELDADRRKMERREAKKAEAKK